LSNKGKGERETRAREGEFASGNQAKKGREVEAVGAIRRPLRKDERGFILVEVLCAVVMLAVGILVGAQFMQTAQALDRRSELLFALAQEAAAVLEMWRAQDVAEVQFQEREFVLMGTKIREHRVVEEVGGSWRMTLRFEWREGGREREQVWATFHA
jgi:type II secretory pathway pseudopilin PulG